MENNNTKKNYMHYMRGAIERIGAKDDPNARVHGSLQMRVKSAEKRTTQTGKQTFQIDGYGYFAGPSGIEYAFGGSKILGPNGAVTMRATAWDNMSGFVENMHIRPGDLIRVYGSWKVHTWTGKDGQERHSLEASVSKVEIDLRNKDQAQTATTQAQTPTAAPAPAPAPKVEVPEIMAQIDSASPFGDDTIEFDPDTELPF